MESGDQGNLDIGKRDILLSNVQLVDVQTIMWQGFQRLRDEDLFPQGVQPAQEGDAESKKPTPPESGGSGLPLPGGGGKVEISERRGRRTDPVGRGRDLILMKFPDDSTIGEREEKRDKSRLNLKTIIDLETLSASPLPHLPPGPLRRSDEEALVIVRGDRSPTPRVEFPPPPPGDGLAPPSDPGLPVGGGNAPGANATEKPERKILDAHMTGNGVDVGTSVVVSECDMDHNHHSLLLSQISQSGALPAITPSQVSSVLSELLVEPSSLGEPLAAGQGLLQSTPPTSGGGRFLRLDGMSPVVLNGPGVREEPAGGRFAPDRDLEVGSKKQARRNGNGGEGSLKRRSESLLLTGGMGEVAHEGFVKLEPLPTNQSTIVGRNEESGGNGGIRVKEDRGKEEERAEGEGGGRGGNGAQRPCKVIVECKLGRVRWYKCRNCGFLAVRKATVEEHCSTGDKDAGGNLEGNGKGIPGCLNRKRTKLRCLGCQNIFHSGQSLKVHLTADHEVLDSDVDDLLVTCVVANKLWKSEAAKLRSASTGKSEPLQTGDLVVPLPVPDPGVVPEGRSKEGKPLSGERDGALPDFGVPPRIDQRGMLDSQRCPGTALFQGGGYGTGVAVPSHTVKNRKGSSASTSRKRVREGGGGGTTCVEEVIGETKIIPGEGERRDEGGGGLPGLFGKARPSPRPKFPPDGVKIEKRDPGNSLRCDFDGCNYKFDYQANLDYHKQCHSEDSKWKCPECELVSTNWPKLSVHLWKQHSIDMELYSCDKCSYKTNSLSRLINVHKWIHGEERLFSCDVCPKSFKNVKQLMNHKGIHRAKERRLSRAVEGDGGGRGGSGNGSLHPSTDCSLCGRSFSDGRMLRQHVDIVHRRLRPYLCSVCGHSAGSKGSLRIHARIHTGEKPYSCPDCDYVTGDHNSLRRHKMQHTGDKPYNCPFCPYACIQATTYKSHLKNKHPGMDEGLMFSCDLCNFRTVKKENFLAHSSCHNLSGNQVGDTTVDDPFRILDASKLITQVDVSRVKRAKAEEEVFSDGDEALEVEKNDFSIGIGRD